MAVTGSGAVVNCPKYGLTRLPAKSRAASVKLTSIVDWGAYGTARLNVMAWFDQPTESVPAMRMPFCATYRRSRHSRWVDRLVEEQRDRAGTATPLPLGRCVMTCFA